MTAQADPHQAILDATLGDAPIPTFDTKPDAVTDLRGGAPARVDDPTVPSEEVVPRLRQETHAEELVEEAPTPQDAAPEAAEREVEEPAPAAPAAQPPATTPATALPQSLTLSAEQFTQLLQAQKEALQPPQPKVEPPPPAKLPQELALEAFVTSPESRARVVKHVLGGHYKDGAENDPGQLAIVESFLHSELKTAKVEQRLAAFERGQQESARQNAMLQAQQAADNLFNQHLSQFAEVSPEMQGVLADQVYLNQTKGMTLEAATKAAFETGKKALGLRMKGAVGRPTNQQQAVRGKEAAAAVVRQPTGQAPQARSSKGPATLNDVLKEAFS